MPVNAPLLWKVYDHIKAHPEEWDQQSWGLHIPVDLQPELLPVSQVMLFKTLGASCGTTFCFAGHTAQMTGHRLDWKPIIPGSPALRLETCDDGADTVSNTAAAELGLELDQACALFYGENQLDEIHTWIENFTGETRPE
jgi:hypothetical protein